MPGKPPTKKRRQKQGKRKRRKWIPTVKESKVPWSGASQPEKRRRLKELLDIIRTEGNAGSIEIPIAQDALLQSIETKVGLKKRGLITPPEISLLGKFYSDLQRLGAKLPDINFSEKKK